VSRLRNKLLAQALLALSQLAFPLVTYPVVTKALGAQGLGRVNFADSIVQTVLIIASLGIPLYGIREIAINKGVKEKQAATYFELMLLQSVFILPALALIWIIGSISHVTPSLLWTGSIALVASCLGGEWFLQGREAFLWVAIRSFFIRAITAVLVFRLIKTPGDAPLYYMLLTASVVLTLLLNFFVIGNDLRRPQEKLHPWRHLKKINWVYACYVLASLYTVADSLILGWLCPENVVGYYSFGYKLVRLSAMLIPTLGVVFIPAIAFHHAASDKEKMQQQVNASQQLIFFLGMPLSVFFFVLAPELIDVFAHGKFQPSVAVIRILSLIPLLVSFSHLTGTQLLVSIKKEKIYMAFLAAGCLLNIVADLIFIPFFREQAAAFSNLATEAFVAIGTFIYLQKNGLLKLQGNHLFYCFCCALILYPITWLFRWLQWPSISVLIASGIITGTIYLLLTHKTWRFSKESISEIPKSPTS
jgi:O-antigen/teichoic acid export membrane protein